MLISTAEWYFRIQPQSLERLGADRHSNTLLRVCLLQDSRRYICGCPHTENELSALSPWPPPYWTPIASLLGLVFIIAFPADSVRRVSPNFLVAVVTFADWYSGLFRLRQNRPQTQDTIRPHLRLEATNHIFHLFSAVIMLFKIIATAVTAAITAISAIIFFIFIHFVSAIR